MCSTVTGFAPGTGGGTSVLTWARAGAAQVRISAAAKVVERKVFVVMVNGSLDGLTIYKPRMMLPTSDYAQDPHAYYVGMKTVLILALFTLLGGIAQSQQKPCSRAQLLQAEKEAVTLRTWNVLYESYR